MPVESGRQLFRPPIVDSPEGGHDRSGTSIQKGGGQGGVVISAQEPTRPSLPDAGFTARQEYERATDREIEDLVDLEPPVVGWISHDAPEQLDPREEWVPE